MIFLFHKLGNHYLDEHWKDMTLFALSICNQIKSNPEPEIHFKSLISLLKKISSTTRSFCNESDGLIFFGKFISLLPTFSQESLESSFMQSRFKTFIQDCFTISRGYGSQKVTKRVNFEILC